MNRKNIFNELAALKGVTFIMILIGILFSCEKSTLTSSSTSKDSITIQTLSHSKSAGREVRITADTSNQNNPDIDGQRIVWEDHRNGNADVYLYDLASQTEIQITSDSNFQGEPAIAGNHVTYSGAGNDSKDIFHYNLVSQAETQLTFSSQPFRENRPVISGNHIVWNDGFTLGGSVSYYVFNLADNSEFSISGGSLGPSSDDYAISGNHAVFTGYGPTMSDLYLCDVSTETCSFINPQPGAIGQVDIDGDYIVWDDNRNGNRDIFLFDLATQTETQITSDASNQTDPVIYGNNIVWVDERNGNRDIYLYNLFTGTEAQITTDASDQYDPAISGSRIVWTDERNGNTDIYLYNIPVSKASVAGVGWINSPAGAYPEDASLTGKGQFAFTARYSQRAGIPHGNARFMLKEREGNILQFKSTKFEQLSGDGTNFWLTGKGTIKKTNSSCSFLLGGIEGSVDTQNQKDKLRIKIWDQNGIIYDNQMGDPDYAGATESIYKGHVVIHDEHAL